MAFPGTKYSVLSLLFCLFRCKSIAWRDYHQLLCEGYITQKSGCSDLAQAINQLNEFCTQNARAYPLLIARFIVPSRLYSSFNSHKYFAHKEY